MMSTFKNWRKWFSQQPFSFQWVLWIILLRPVIDVFWELKSSGFVSPLQVAGLLTFVLAIIFGFRLPAKNGVSFPKSLFVFSILLIVNMLLLLSAIPKFQTVIHVIRTLTPVVVLFYMIKVIHNEKRFHGLLFTYLVSSIFPLTILAYEVVFDPISYHALAESRGGGFRLSGPYADVFNYMAFLIGDLIILSFLFVRSAFLKKRLVSFARVALVLLGITIGIKGLQHQASWVVFITILLTGVFYSVGHRKVKRYVFLLSLPVLLAAPIVIVPMATKLFSKEIKAYGGAEKDKGRILNGRLFRWEKYFELWGNESVATQLIGVSFSNLEPKQIKTMSGGGMHSDYVRFLFTSGIVGFVSLMLFYAQVGLKRRKFRAPEKFFISACLIAFLLYSVSSLPFGGSGSLMYLTFAAMAIALRPSKLFYTSFNNG